MEQFVRRQGQGLMGALASVPDPRQRRGRRHPLPAMLALAVSAMLCGCRSLYAIAQWGREHPELTQALGFTRSQTPCGATLHYLFKALDIEAFEGALRGWAQKNVGDGEEVIAIDGKGLRGTHGEELPGIRLVAAYAQKAGLVLAQKGGTG